MKTTMVLCAGLAACAACAAAPNGYGDASAAYKAELKADEFSQVNTGFIGNLAGSQAKRQADAVGTDAGGGDAPAPRRGPGTPGDGINIASPQIFGTVRGNVTVIVQRGAVRGSITSVQR